MFLHCKPTLLFVLQKSVSNTQQPNVTAIYSPFILPVTPVLEFPIVTKLCHFYLLNISQIHFSSGNLSPQYLSPKPIQWVLASLQPCTFLLLVSYPLITTRVVYLKQKCPWHSPHLSVTLLSARWCLLLNLIYKCSARSPPFIMLLLSLLLPALHLLLQ